LSTLGMSCPKRAHILEVGEQVEKVSLGLLAESDSPPKGPQLPSSAYSCPKRLLHLARSQRCRESAGRTDSDTSASQRMIEGALLAAMLDDRFRSMAVFVRRVGLSRKRTFRAVLRRRERAHVGHSAKAVRSRKGNQTSAICLRQPWLGRANATAATIGVGRLRRA
jgi:hypothetical protein